MKLLEHFNRATRCYDSTTQAQQKIQKEFEFQKIEKGFREMQKEKRSNNPINNVIDRFNYYYFKTQK